MSSSPFEFDPQRLSGQPVPRPPQIPSDDPSPARSVPIVYPLKQGEGGQYSLDTGAPRAPLVYPLLKPHDWKYKHLAAHRLLTDKVEGAPIIAFGFDTGNNYQFVQQSQCEDADQLYTDSLTNLSALNYPWEHSDKHGLRIADCSGKEFSAEMVLDATAMLKCHQILAADQIVVVAPRRTCLMATSYGIPEDKMKLFVQLAMYTYRDDSYGHAPISPVLFILEKGIIKRIAFAGAEVAVNQTRPTAPPGAPRDGLGFFPGQTPQPAAVNPFGGQAAFSPEQARPAAASNMSATKSLFDRITTEIRKIYVGQEELVLGTLVALFSGGHVLIESVPGLGKTLFVRTLGRVLGCQFGRIQFTADLMPSDITGAPVFDMKTQEFRFRPGPVFTQLLLGDEINRSPAKTHAALLEIMQEYCVTIERTTHKIERPFLVLATQNPIESEGTYNLPEAQLDRFMFKIKVEYPSAAEEAEILLMHSRHDDVDRRLTVDLHTVTSPQEILATTQLCGQVRVDPKLLHYINSIVRLTRKSPHFHLGASPRAGIGLMQGARTLAAFYGRDYAVPDDVMHLVLPALRHRVVLTPEAEVEGRAVDELLMELVRTVEVPRL